jgi:hypothetical protein
MWNTDIVTIGMVFDDCFLKLTLFLLMRASVLVGMCEHICECFACDFAGVFPSLVVCT